MFSKLLEGLRLRSVERQTRRELNHLTDRELADIGINRWDVNAIARSARTSAARDERQAQLIGIGPQAIIS